MTKTKFRKGSQVVCPCCSNPYDTDDYLPFTPQGLALHESARDLLVACEAILARFQKAKASYMPRPIDQDEWIDRLQSLIAKAKPT